MGLEKRKTVLSLESDGVIEKTAEFPPIDYHLGHPLSLRDDVIIDLKSNFRSYTFGFTLNQTTFCSDLSGIL